MILISEYNIFLKKGTCLNCGNALVIHRRYSGQFLCTSCFTNSIEKVIYKTISKYKMLRPTDKIVVALSGGKDSISLLHNLIKIQEKNYHAEPITALTIDEGISGYRLESIKKAKEFCKKNDIEHKIVSFKENLGKTLDSIIDMKSSFENNRYSCNYCATGRRRLLNDWARNLDADVIAMGHNLTDIAETFLMNILYKRFYLIKNQYLFKQRTNESDMLFVKKITPLMRIPEEEIFLYANIKNLDYYPSHCPYREKDPIVRKRVLEFIQKCKHYSPEIEFNLLNGFLKMSELLYDNSKEESFKKCQNCGYPCGNNQYCTYCELKMELEG